MPEEPSSSAHQEKVELNLQSKIPTRSQLGGLWHTLNMLKQIERRINRINRMAVMPGGVGAQAARMSAQATAQNAVADAINRTTEAHARLAKQKTTIHHIEGQEPVTSVTETTKPSPGVTKSTTTVEGELRREDEILDFEKMRKDQVDEQRRMLNDRSKLQQNLHSAKTKSDSELLKASQAEQKRIDALHNQQAKVLQRGQKLGFQQLKANEFERKFEELKRQGFQIVSRTSKEDQLGRIRERTIMQRALGGRKDRAELVGIRGGGGMGGPPGQLLSGSFGMSSGPDKQGRHTGGAHRRDFLTNLGHVSTWATSVFTLYGSIRLASGAMKNLVSTSHQIARLSQVFTGVGGTAKQLADDVQRLAAANGRSRDEALQAAWAWSQLGLSKAEANEAVRVSLMAANVAQITAAQATDHLQSIMAAYGMRVRNLAGFLGTLNEMANTYNVTNKAMLEGLSKTAAIAKQSGMSIAELTGIIGATVGISGQSGANIGNAMKSIIGRFSDPNIQRMLREEFKIEVTADGTGEVKDMSQVFSELFVEYQRLTDAERRLMLFRVGGRHQLSRLASMMDSYVKAQALAINAQLRLSSAEEENAKIKAALQAQLQGLVTEWERFVNLQGQGTFSKGLGQMTMALRNLLVLMNTPAGSVFMTGMIAMMTVVTAKVLITTLAMKRMAGTSGFVVNSMHAVRDAFRGIGRVMNTAIMQFVNGGTNLTKMGATARIAAGGLFDFSRRANIAAMRSGRLALGLRAAALGAKALAVTIATLWTAFIPMAAIVAGIWVFNRVINASARAAEAADRKIQGFNDRLEQTAAAARSAAQAAKLFNTVSKALPGARREDQNRMIEGVSEVAFHLPDGRPDIAKNNALKEELRTMRDQGNFAGIQAKLEELRSSRIMRAMVERDKELKLMQSQTKELEDQLDIAKRKGNRKREEEIKSKLLQLSEKQTATIIEQSGDMQSDLDDFAASSLEHLIFMERQKMVAQSIADIYRDMAGSNPVDKLNAELLANQAIISQTEDMIKKLNHDLENPAIMPVSHKDKEIREAREMLKDFESQLNAIPKSALDMVESNRFSMLRGDEKIAFSETNFLGLTEPFARFQEWWVKARRDKTTRNVLDSMGLDTDNINEVLSNIDAVRTHIGQLFDELKHAPQSGRDSFLTKAAIKDRKEFLDELKKQRAGLLAQQRGREMQSEFETVRRFGAREASGMALGSTEAERLLNQERGIQKLIDKRDQLSKSELESVNANHQVVLAIQAITDMENVRLQKAELRKKLTVDEYNLSKEMTKEFQRSMLMAGPSDLLRKMAIQSIVRRGGVNLGAFMALSPEARQDAQNASPRLNPQISGIRRQLGQLGPEETMEQTIKAESHLRGRRTEFMKRVDLGGLTQDQISIQAREASAALNGLGKSAANASDALNGLPGVIAGMVKEALPSSGGRISHPINQSTQAHSESIPFITYGH